MPAPLTMHLSNFDNLTDRLARFCYDNWDALSETATRHFDGAPGFLFFGNEDGLDVSLCELVSLNEQFEIPAAGSLLATTALASGLVVAWEFELSRLTWINVTAEAHAAEMARRAEAHAAALAPGLFGNTPSN